MKFQVLRRTTYQTKRVNGEFFVWEDDFKGVNLIAQFRKSCRVILGCILGKKGEPVEKNAEKIYSSLEDQSLEEKMLWSVFDFCFAPPRGFRLESYSFLTGHLRLDFLYAGNSFILERLSVAKILLEGKNFSQWAREFCLTNFRNVLIEVGYPREGFVEEGMCMVGRELGRIRLIKKRLFRSTLWHCKRQDQIFGVTELVRKRDDSYTESLARQVKCHHG